MQKSCLMLPIEAVIVTLCYTPYKFLEPVKLWGQLGQPLPL